MTELYRNLEQLVKKDGVRKTIIKNYNYFFNLNDSVRRILEQILDCMQISNIN